MILSYKELEGKIKVGDKVRAVPGKNNPCGELQDDGSNEATITDVTENGFYIDDWYYGFFGDWFLDLIPSEITWDTLKVGDKLLADRHKFKVLAVLGTLVGVSTTFDHDCFGHWNTKQSLQTAGYTIVQPTPPPPSKTTLTMDEIAKKFEIDVKNLEIKKE